MSKNTTHTPTALPFSYSPDLKWYYQHAHKYVRVSECFQITTVMLSMIAKPHQIHPFYDLNFQEAGNTKQWRNALGSQNQDTGAAFEGRDSDAVSSLCKRGVTLRMQVDCLPKQMFAHIRVNSYHMHLAPSTAKLDE